MGYTFSLIGLIIFILPMIINVVYVIFPPVNAGDKEEHNNNKFLGIVEQVSRILFAIAICGLTTTTELNYKSILLYLSIVFLVLYHVVWIRYFINGRDVKMLGEYLFFVPMPLAVFPVLYYLFASLWVNNYIAAVIMIIFGIAHNIISYKNLYCNKGELR